MKKHIRAIVLTAGVVVGAILIAVVLLMPVPGPRVFVPMVTRNVSPPAELDTSATRMSSSGLYRVSFTSVIEPIPINQIHNWTLHVETTDGHPVNDARIGVSGGMAQHGHGLPTRPRVTQHLGNGYYVVEGLKFHMTGKWEVRFDISSSARSDSVIVSLLLQ